MFTAAVITVSDRSFRGERPDEGGPNLVQLLREKGYDVVHTDLVPDEPDKIGASICHTADDLDIALIITTGGTGFAPRDITPEATMTVIERMVPGIPETMRARSLQYTERAMLSRGICGIRRRSLIINLPGSPKAAKENLLFVTDAVEHGLIMLRGQPMNCAELDK